MGSGVISADAGNESCFHSGTPTGSTVDNGRAVMVGVIAISSASHIVEEDSFLKVGGLIVLSC